MSLGHIYQNPGGPGQEEEVKQKPVVVIDDSRYLTEERWRGLVVEEGGSLRVETAC